MIYVIFGKVSFEGEPSDAYNFISADSRGIGGGGGGVGYGDNNLFSTLLSGGIGHAQYGLPRTSVFDIKEGDSSGRGHFYYGEPKREGYGDGGTGTGYFAYGNPESPKGSGSGVVREGYV